MSKIDKIEFAKECIQEINKSNAKDITTKKVIDEIENLIYSDTKRPINNSDKKLIIEYINTKLDKNIKFGDKTLEKAADNKYYLLLIDNALARLNGDNGDKK